MVWIQYQVHPGFNSLGIGTVNAVYHSADLWALFKGDDSGAVRIVPAVTFGSVSYTHLTLPTSDLV